ncbi:MAG: nucleotidyltransferase domain-containing protein [Candidatus Kariarchaeaceae archaeon]
MKEQIKFLPESTQVTYSEAHWSLLKRFRKIAKKYLVALKEGGYQSFIYGSLARGDITSKSDIDILIPSTLSSGLLLLKLEWSELEPYLMEIVQATPNHAIKAHLHFRDEVPVCISFPCVSFSEREREFYSFGGKINLKQLETNERVIGVDKRLMLIQPSKEGHLEKAILGLSPGKLKELELSEVIIEERKRVLTRRSEIGRTGVYLRKVIDPEIGIEKTLDKMAVRDPILRKKMARS